MLKLIYTSLLTLLTPALANPIQSRQSASWPDPIPLSGNNTYIHDPSLIRRADGTWFRFSTLGNIAIASAPSLTGPWTYLGAMLPQGATMINIHPQQELWAPDVFGVDGTYFAYYSVSRSGFQNSSIGVATSTTLEPGSWTDHGSIQIPHSSAYNIIDGNLFRECATCEPVFNFGSAWNDVYQTSLTSDFLSWSSTDGPRQLLFNSTFPPGQDFRAIVEGSFLFWWPSAADSSVKYYYLFFSSGQCCDFPSHRPEAGDEYKIMVCRATAAAGPFVDQEGRSCLTESGGTLVLGSHGGNVYAPGGQGVVVDPDDNKIALYYHYVDEDAGEEYADYQFGINYLDFAMGWPVVVE
ncbi:glycosyl hydrolase [Lophiotrema nucula]|uniref:Arabinan endo-1,5-alpha-L-arabinosidase n=1 Tax=Lophiotrema nucula TaxID=690887 RepID=A0A6A5YWD4_9PLEO|nr:glycosyl hydrolase [Lophiotrema nucula]